MVKVIYGEHSRQADLAGKSVAEVRELYESEFNIPDQAQASLNGKQLKRELETETKLGGEDKLSFEEKSRMGLVLLGALLLTLAITGGLFVYTTTTATVSLGLTGRGEFATVGNVTAPPTWVVWGHYKGKMDSGDLFEIDPDTAYTGDLSVMVMIANAYDLVEAYRVLVMKVSLYEDNGSGSANKSARIGDSQYLSLGKGEVTFDFETAGAQTPIHVYLDGGFYNTFHSWDTDKEDITLLCDVIQKGAMAP